MKSNLLIISVLFVFVNMSFLIIEERNKESAYTYEPKIGKVQTIHFFNKNLYEAFDNSLFFDLNSRSNITVSKDDLTDLPSFLGNVSKLSHENIENATLISISQLDDEMLPVNSIETRGISLNQAQNKLMKSFDYGDNFLVKIIISKINQKTGSLMNRLLTYHITMVPEKIAEYSLGKKTLLDFIRQNTQKEIHNIKKNKFGNGRISFVVLQNGQIGGIKQESKTGINIFDEKMVRLLNNLPGKWIPARNALGKPVAQELILYYGNRGC